MGKSISPPSVPTDAEILGYANVPVSVAAKYIGWSTSTLYYALQDRGRPIPFGFATERPNGGWVYNISPGGLVKYHNGELPVMSLNEILEAVMEGVDKLFSTKFGALSRILSSIAQV